jgi:hypothetical protein
MKRTNNDEAYCKKYCYENEFIICARACLADPFSCDEPGDDPETGKPYPPAPGNPSAGGAPPPPPRTDPPPKNNDPPKEKPRKPFWSDPPRD